MIYQTDNSFKNLDSALSSFTPSSFESNQLQMTIGFDQFDSNKPLSDFNYIIHNTLTNQRDTLSEISYSTSTTEQICNKCDGGISCSDEYFTSYEFDDLSLTFNKNSYTSFNIEYQIK